MSLMTNTTSTRSDKVRSDIVCFETATGSAMFSMAPRAWSVHWH